MGLELHVLWRIIIVGLELHVLWRIIIVGLELHVLWRIIIVGLELHVLWGVMSLLDFWAPHPLEKLLQTFPWAHYVHTPFHFQYIPFIITLCPL